MASIFNGYRLRKRRKKLGMSLDKLAEISNCAKSYLWELETRKSRSPSIDKVFELSCALGVTMAWLCGLEGKIPLPTRKAAEMEAQNRKVHQRLKELANWVPDWKNKKQSKYNAFFVYDIERMEIDQTFSARVPGNIFSASFIACSNAFDTIEREFGADAVKQYLTWE